MPNCRKFLNSRAGAFTKCLYKCAVWLLCVALRAGFISAAFRLRKGWNFISMSLGDCQNLRFYLVLWCYDGIILSLVCAKVEICKCLFESSFCLNACVCVCVCGAYIFIYINRYDMIWIEIYMYTIGCMYDMVRISESFLRRVCLYSLRPRHKIQRGACSQNLNF